MIGLGHDVIARKIYVKEVRSVTAREHPDVALVGLGSSSEHALDLISEIVREASCPVNAILQADELQSAIDITLQRFSEHQTLQ